MGIGSFLKKMVSLPVKIVKAVVDPVFDFATNSYKAITSPFTGAFDMEDASVTVDATSQQIKASTIVDFNAANRTIPVLYGNRVEIATIPVFVNTWGTNSADTSKQYLYMAAVISQGFHGSNQDTGVDGVMGSLLSRMTIDGKPVHLGGFTNTMNDNYSSAYDGSTALSKTDNSGGIFASGKGGVQPTQHSITKGTFADRLVIQYFDGSSDQPVSSLLNEHPEWSPTGQSKLSGMHYVALRFLIQAADETVGAGDGGGTYGNPYSGVPAVVVTTSGRSNFNIVAGNAADPGYQERFQTSYAEKVITSWMSYHQPLAYPNADGIQFKATGATVDNIDKHVEYVNSDTKIEIQRFKDYQPRKYTDGSTQPVNIHDILYNLGWTYDWVWFVPSLYTYNSDSTSYSYSYSGEGQPQFWLKHVGGGHYKLVNKVNATTDLTATTGALTFFAYNSSIVEADINSATPAEETGDSTTAEYRFFSTASILQQIENDWNSGHTFKLRVRDRETNTNDVYMVNSIYTNNMSDTNSPFITIGIHNEDSSAVGETFYKTVPVGAEIYVEIYKGSTNIDKYPTNWNLLEDNGYKAEGLTYEGYRCDPNPVEYLLDYLLNSDYGVGLSINDLDRKSWQKAAIACDRIPSVFDFDRTLFYFGGGTLFTNLPQRHEYMYGENATTGGAANGYVIRTANNGHDRQFIINTSRTHIENVNTILASIGASMPVVDGKFHLLLENAGDPEDSASIPPTTALTISAHIKDEHIIGGISVSTASVNDKFNQVKIDYTDVINNSQPGSVLSPDPVDDSTNIRTNYLNEDSGKKLEGTFSFPGIIDEYTAKKMATLLLKKSRGQPNIVLTCSSVALNCLPGDFIRLTSDVLAIDDVYRVTASTLNPDHTVALTCSRHVPDVYDVTDQGQIFEARRNIMDIK